MGGTNAETVWPSGRSPAALALTSGLAAAQSKVTIAVGAAAACYLQRVLAKQLGEFEKRELPSNWWTSRAARTR